MIMAIWCSLACSFLWFHSQPKQFSYFDSFTNALIGLSVIVNNSRKFLVLNATLCSFLSVALLPIGVCYLLRIDIVKGIFLLQFCREILQCLTSSDTIKNRV